MGCFDACGEWWRAKSVRFQLMTTYGTFVFGSGLIIYILLLVYAIVVPNEIIETSKRLLENEIANNTRILARANSNIFIAVLNSMVYNGLYTYKNMIQISQKPSFNVELQRGYFDAGNDTLAQPLTYDPRYNRDVSLTHSSYLVAGKTLATLSTTPASAFSILNRSMHADQVIKPAYASHSDFVAGYSGFSDSGLFITYPGVSTLHNDPTRLYDPRTRGWYTDATEFRGTYYTNPYQDFSGKGWMITVSTPIRVGAADIGVAGIDIFIETIKAIIQHVHILGAGKASLFTADGTVVADSEWRANPSDASITYRDLQTPSLTEADWTAITSSESIKRDNGAYLYVSQRITLGNRIFYIVASVPTSIIFGPIEETLNDIEEARGTTIGIVSAIMVAAIVIAGIITMIFANNVARPLQLLGDASSQMIRNLGKSDITEGVDMDIDTDIKEINNVIQGFGKAMVEMRTHDNTNPWYNNAANLGFTQWQQQVPCLDGAVALGIPLHGDSNGYQCPPARYSPPTSSKQSEGILNVPYPQQQTRDHYV